MQLNLEDPELQFVFLSFIWSQVESKRQKLLHVSCFSVKSLVSNLQLHPCKYKTIRCTCDWLAAQAPTNQTPVRSCN